VDVALFPIDTVKTRLQSERGFWRSGGFRGIYKGLGIAATGKIGTDYFQCIHLIRVFVNFRIHTISSAIFRNL